MRITRTGLKTAMAVVLAVAFGGLMAGMRGATDLASICVVVGAAYLFGVRGVAMPRGFQVRRVLSLSRRGRR